MRRSSVVAIVLAASGCIEIPANIHAQFKHPDPAERSNYRPGVHGAARPLVEEPPPTAKNAAVEDAGAEPNDGGTP